MPIHSNGNTVFSLPHIEGITLGAGEEVNEVAGGAGGMGVDGIGEVGDRACSIQFPCVCVCLSLPFSDLFNSW